MHARLDGDYEAGYARAEGWGGERPLPAVQTGTCLLIRYRAGGA
jgi:hypothetical protein